MIHVIATIQLNPGTRAEFLNLFNKLVPTVRKEVGCISYEAAVDLVMGHPAQETIGEDAVVVVEKWASLADLQAHLAAPHMEAFRADAGRLIKKLSLRVLSPV